MFAEPKACEEDDGTQKEGIFEPAGTEVHQDRDADSLSGAYLSMC
jgi:hypothetical protein